MKVPAAGTAFLLVLTLLMARPGRAAAAAGTAPELCASSSHAALAARISRGIEAARRGRESFVAVEVDDPGAGVLCRLDSGSHFDSASVVKVTILGTLLRDAQAAHRSLTRTERALAWAMITRSDNGAASALWDEDGRSRLQRFLNAAGMTHTVLGPGGAWGLTRITAADETRLLWLLLQPNRVLGTSSRDYALALMADVTRPSAGASRPGRRRAWSCTSRTAGCRWPRTAGGSTASAGSLVTARTTASWC